MTDNNSERKATDILLSIEDKINTLSKTISVYDLNTKLILDRVNKIYKCLEGLSTDVATMHTNSGVLPEEEKPLMVNSEDISKIQIEENPLGARRTSRSETYQLPVEPVAPDDDGRKIPVEQRVVDDKGKDLFMADITIKNQNGEVVKKLKTNAAGKWHLGLKAGHYFIQMTKTDTATMKKLEATQEIDVLDSMQGLRLPTAIIKR